MTTKAIDTQNQSQDITQNQTPDYEAIKAKQQIVWSTGHYSKIGSLLQIVGERLIESMDPKPGSLFLDVAAGNGNLTLAAARRYCQVVSTDYVASSLEDGKARAEANGFDVRFEVADAENLPYEEGTFDAVGSTFGVMFTPNQSKAASELLRVCRSGGRIGMANWTPDGFIGDMFKTIGKFNTPPAGLQSPARWGTEAFLFDTFNGSENKIRIHKKDFVFRFASAEHFMDVFMTFYGPMMKAFEAQDEKGKEDLHAALMKLLKDWNTATDGSLFVPSEYLEVIVEKQ